MDDTVRRSPLARVASTLRGRLQRMAGWYHAARTTFDVLRVLDREARFRPAAISPVRPPFVARTGFVI